MTNEELLLAVAEASKPRVPVRFQIVVSVHDGTYHLFEMNYDEMPVVFPSMLLMNVPGIPNIVGPAAEFDNRIVKLCYDGKTKRALAQVGGLRLASCNLDEAKEELPEWEYIRELKNVDDRDQLNFLQG